jgi:uncharacterized membrane protein YeiH
MSKSSVCSLTPGNTPSLARWCWALGSGIVRDLLLQRQPPGVVRDPTALLAVIVTLAGAFLTRILAIGLGLKGWAYA